MSKKKKFIITIILLVIVAISIAVVLIVKRQKKEPEFNTITFAVPNLCSIDNKALKLLNDELVKDGYNFEIEIKYLDFLEYDELIKSELKNNNTDIAFLGFGNSDGNNIYSIINSGLVLELDEILTQESGKLLYNAFPENLWEAVKCNKHIYSIPSALGSEESIYAVFNKDYVSQEDISAWDESIEGIYEIIKNTEWNDSKNPPFQYLLTGFSFDEMIGCEIVNGLLFDYDTLTVNNPLESEKVVNYLTVLEQMRNEGYLSRSVSFYGNDGLNNSSVYNNVESGNFVAALGKGSVDEVFYKSNVSVVRFTDSLRSRVNASIAVSKNTENLDDVITFLGLLYSDGKYGNILLYGEEGTDYKVVDGVACDINGNAHEDEYLTKLCFNLFINVYPVEGENYMNNRRDEFFSYYDSIQLSPFIGFEVDTSKMNNVKTEINDFLNSLCIMNEDETFITVEEAVLSAKDKLVADGIEEYISSVETQWEEYRQ